MHKKKYSIINFPYSILLGVFLFISIISEAQYRLDIDYVDKDTSFKTETLKLQTNFSNSRTCAEYVNKLPAHLRSLGFMAASVDSVHYDSSFASIQLYLGKKQYWLVLKADSIDNAALSENNFDENNFENKPVDMLRIQSTQQHLLNYYERNGYPFASVFLDSIKMTDSGMNAMLKVRKGPLYHIDSIHVYGDAKISNHFLQELLGISNGSIYNADKLKQVSKQLSGLPFLKEVHPSNLTMLGTGSVLNLYLQAKKSNQVDFLIGFLPANDQTGKLQLTGDANLNLKNAFGSGETILFNWQQLQLNSPRLNLGYQQPYIFNSPFGLDFSFSMFKKDSAYLQLSAQAGVQYLLSEHQSGKLFLQTQSTILLASGVDTNRVIATKTLPSNIDVSSNNIGIDYKWNNTNYQLNPRKGNELNITTTVGIKRIKENSTILDIKDPSFNYASLYDTVKLRSYQFRIITSFTHYFPSGKQSTLKLAGNVGIFSSEDIFQNELFQIGGYRLLRGFDEESIYATQYGVGTAEYRYLLGLNSYFFGFIDAGWVKDKYQSVNLNGNFIGTGIGIEFETKVGLLNISYAVGKRSDETFNLSHASKIHFGYVNYF